MFQTMSYSEVKPYLDNFKAKKINETIWEIIKSNLEKLHDSEKWQEILFENELNPHIEEQDIHYIKQALDLLPDPKTNLGMKKHGQNGQKILKLLQVAKERIYLCLYDKL